jgi:thiosulfate dehydrogenase [quinone] large subunit
MPNEASSNGPSRTQEVLLVLLRMALGWHLLYEGLVKLTSPGWTAAAYLSESRWLFSGAFHWIVAHPAVLRAVDLLNVWGLVLVGLALLTGAFARPAAISGALLLGLYYVAAPPLAGFPRNGAEGSYLVVNKNLVEAAGLLVVALTNTGRICGLDRLIHGLFRGRTRPAAA